MTGRILNPPKDEKEKGGVRKMDQTAPLRTRLEILLYENGISKETAAKAIGISKKSMNNKVKRRTQL